MSAGPTELVVVTYGTWDSNDTGFTLEAAHEIAEDATSASVDLTVVVQGSTETELVSRVAAMKAQLTLEHQRVKVVSNSVTAFDYTGTLADVSGSAPAAAQGVTCTWALVGEFRSALSEAYRIQIEALKPALQTGKTGKRNQQISLVAGPNGMRGLSVDITFTPDASGNTARVVSDDGTNGFDARVTEIFTALGLTQSKFEASGKRVSSDEDDRAVTVSEFYREVPFDQSDGTRDNTSLADVSYRCRVVRKPSLGPSLSGPAGRLAELTVTFSAKLVYAGSDLNPDSVITTTVLPYITSTIAPRATVGGRAIVMAHTLQITDLPEPRVAGSVLYLVPEGSTLLSASALIREQDSFGKSFLPILDRENPYRVRRMRGPGLRVAQLVVATEELGDDNPELVKLAAKLAAQLTARGYEAVGEAKQSEGFLRSFAAPQGYSGQVETSIRTLTQEWRYTGEAGGGGAFRFGVGSTQAR